MIFLCKELPYISVYLDCYFIILFFCKVLPYMYGVTLHGFLYRLSFYNDIILQGYIFVRYYLTCKVLPYITLYIDCHFIVIFFVRYYLTWLSI